MITKQDLTALMTKEFATTLKVMRAYPTDKADLKPHDKSNSAAHLMRTFVYEMYLMQMGLGDTLSPDTFSSYDPKEIETLIADFEKETQDVLARIGDADFEKVIPFAGREYKAGEFMQMMLHDQIHHRGQLSVYIRLAGGLVPSIYGPSADDKTTNLD